MPEGKNQHFVPQFYLRNFARSDSTKLICTFHIPSARYVPNATIKGHACDDYFYGKDGAEQALQEFEGKVSPTIARIIASERLPELDFPINGGHPVKGVNSPWEVQLGQVTTHLHC